MSLLITCNTFLQNINILKVELDSKPNFFSQEQIKGELKKLDTLEGKMTVQYM